MIRSAWISASVCALTLGVAHAQLQPVPAPGAPAALTPRVHRVANAAVVADVAPVGPQGMSMNLYESFDVGPEGLILNASPVSADTRLGGSITPNWLVGPNQAAVIVNQVVGASASSLLGPIEVAGPTADVLIVNPNGIRCNGCGFINVGRATLATGQVLRNMAGDVTGLHVEGGDLAIGPGGLDARGAAQLDLIARTLHIDGNVDARGQLIVITGRNDIDARGNFQPMHPSGDRPPLGIVMGQGTAMRADRIRLRATESGVGVRLSGDVLARHGDMSMDVAGNLVVRGLAARRDVKVFAGSIDHRGARTQAGGDVLAYARAGTFDDTRGRISGRAVTVKALELRNRDGDIHAMRALKVDALHIDNHDGGRLTSGQWLTAQGRLLDNRGGTVRSGRGQELFLDRGLWNAGGRLVSGEELRLRGGKEEGLPVDALQGAAAVDNTNGHIRADREISLHVEDIVTNFGGQIAARSVSVTGRDAAFENANGRVLGDARIELKVGRLRNGGGHVDARAGALSLRATGLDNADGTFRAGTLANITARDMGNARGTVDAGEVVHTNIAALANADGRIASRGKLTLEGGDLTNVRGAITAPDVAIHLQRLVNRGGRISATGRVRPGVGATPEIPVMKLRVDDLRVEGRDARLWASGAMHLRGGRVLVDGARIESERAVDVKAATVEVRGRTGAIASKHALTLAAKRLDANDGGAITSGRSMDIRVGRGSSRGGVIASEADLGLRAWQGFDNLEGGMVKAAYSLQADVGIRVDSQGRDVRLPATLNNEDGTLFAGRTLNLRAGTLRNMLGVVRGKRGLDINLVHQLDNAHGTIDGGQHLEVASAGIDNVVGFMVGDRMELTSTGSVLNGLGSVRTREGALRLDAKLHAIDNRDGRMCARTVLELDAGRIDNARGTLEGRRAVLTARDLDNVRGRVVGRNSARVTGATLANDWGSITTDDALEVIVHRSMRGDPGTIQSTHGPMLVDVAR